MVQRHLRMVSIAAALVLITAGCGDDDSSEAANGATTLRLGHVLAVDHPWHTCGVQHIIDTLTSTPEAGLSLDVSPGGQLGSNEQIVESVSRGNIDLALPGVGSVSPFYEDFGVLEAAYAFDDFAHLSEVWRGDIGRQLHQGAIEEASLHPLGDLWYIGTRHITANKVVRSPADLNGVSMRSQDTPISFANVRALGANPTPVDFGELYLALSQGVVDTEENPLPNILAAKFYEVQDYLILTAHVPQAGVLLLSESTWQDLSSQQQDLLETTATEAAQRVLDCITEQENETLEQWKNGPDSPIEVIEDVDVEAFRANAQRVITEEFADSWGELYKQIRAQSSAS